MKNTFIATCIANSSVKYRTSLVVLLLGLVTACGPKTETVDSSAGPENKSNLGSSFTREEDVRSLSKTLSQRLPSGLYKGRTHAGSLCEVKVSLVDERLDVQMNIQASASGPSQKLDFSFAREKVFRLDFFNETSVRTNAQIFVPYTLSDGRTFLVKKYLTIERASENSVPSSIYIYDQSQTGKYPAGYCVIHSKM